MISRNWASGSGSCRWSSSTTSRSPRTSFAPREEASGTTGTRSNRWRSDDSVFPVTWEAAVKTPSRSPPRSLPPPTSPVGRSQRRVEVSSGERTPETPPRSSVRGGPSAGFTRSSRSVHRTRGPFLKFARNAAPRANFKRARPTSRLASALGGPPRSLRVDERDERSKRLDGTNAESQSVRH